ncbi:MAG: hypothetical protein EA350_17505 [Gemmatimonadales bacterium]|nr:MAG: hypothetical protein EA350_17505 [Gemmatimonadales bacterium]
MIDLPTDRRALAALPLQELVLVLGLTGDVLPVRAMEEALRRGPGAATVAAHLLQDPPEHPDWDPLWILVLLGRFADPRHAPILVDYLERAPEDDHYVFAAAVEALAASGDEILPEVERLLESPDEDARLAGYGVLAQLSTPASGARLVEAAGKDPGMADVLAPALERSGDPAGVGALAEMLPRAPEGFRSDIEHALRVLHFGIEYPDMMPRDWRLRYRCDRVWPVFDPGWLGVARLGRRDPELMARRAPTPLRTVEEVLAVGAEAAGEPGASEGEAPDDLLAPICIVCGAEGDTRQGITTCRLHHEGIRMQQRGLLETLVGELVEIHQAEAGEAEEAGEAWVGGEVEDLSDLFVLLPAAESQWRDLADEADLVDDAASPAELDDLQQDLYEAGLLVDTLRGLIAEGVESLEGARARLTPGTPATVEGESMVEGGAMVITRAHFRLRDPEAVRMALSRAHAIEADPRRVDQYTWFDAPERRVLGVVELQGTGLTLECLSEERLARGRALLERVAGPNLSHRATTVQASLDPVIRDGWGSPRNDDGPRWN